MLREQVIDGISAIGSGRQLALLLHNGMGAWLRAVGSLLPAFKLARESATIVTPSDARQVQLQFPSASSMIGLMPPRYYAEAASLVAGMALAARKDILR
jgi:hypothetical protein